MAQFTPEQRRGLRMAAQVACVLSLVGASAGAAAAAATDRAAEERDVSAVERTEGVLRLQGRGGGCFQPVTWGPPAPAAIDPAELAAFEAMLAAEIA